MFEQGIAWIKSMNCRLHIVTKAMPPCKIKGDTDRYLGVVV